MITLVDAAAVMRAVEDFHRRHGGPTLLMTSLKKATIELRDACNEFLETIHDD